MRRSSLDSRWAHREISAAHARLGTASVSAFEAVERPAGSHVELAGLATSMSDWMRSRDLSLLHLAVQWPLRQPDIACSPYGCSTVGQVEGLLKAATTPLPEGTFEAFEAEFGERVAALGPEKHFYWFKKQKGGSREWKEMAVYPRATWAEAFADK